MFRELLWPQNVGLEGNSLPSSHDPHLAAQDGFGGMRNMRLTRGKPPSPRCAKQRSKDTCKRLRNQSFFAFRLEQHSKHSRFALHSGCDFLTSGNERFPGGKRTFSQRGKSNQKEWENATEFGGSLRKAWENEPFHSRFPLNSGRDLKNQLLAPISRSAGGPQPQNLNLWSHRG